MSEISPKFTKMIITYDKSFFKSSTQILFSSCTDWSVIKRIPLNRNRVLTVRNVVWFIVFEHMVFSDRNTGKTLTQTIHAHTQTDGICNSVHIRVCVCCVCDVESQRDEAHALTQTHTFAIGSVQAVQLSRNLYKIVHAIYVCLFT